MTKILYRGASGTWYFRSSAISGLRDVASIIFIYALCFLFLGPFIWLVFGMYSFTEPVVDRHVGAGFSMLYLIITVLLAAAALTAWYILIGYFIDLNFIDLGLS